MTQGYLSKNTHLIYDFMRNRAKNMIFHENIHCFLIKFVDSFYEVLRNFMTLIVSQKQNTETCIIDNYLTTKQ